jgi:hypothetical protein
MIVQVERPSERSPGAVRHGEYTFDGATVHVYGDDCRLIATAKVPPGDDVGAAARRLLRDGRRSSDFYAPINYPPRGIV